MKKIKIFLASSYELKADREQFEIEIYRKCKLWFGEKIFIHLDIWEDLSARMSTTRLQDEYNKKIKEADIFVLLAYSKVGMYTKEEFETAFKSFQSTQKPFILTYFKSRKVKKEDSLGEFVDKLKNLGHFISPYKDFNDLWKHFNNELDNFLHNDFKEFIFENKSNLNNTTIIQRDKNLNIGTVNGDVNLNIS